MSLKRVLGEEQNHLADVANQPRLIARRRPGAR
jgi:hypothetical protein